jgi:hypothetical protein
VARLVFRYQAYLFFPLLLGEAVSLHVASVQALARRAARHRSWERALITAHGVGYLTAVFLVLSPVKTVVFILVLHAPAQPAPRPGPDRSVLPAARPALLPGQPGRFLRPGAASPQCRREASSPGHGDLALSPVADPRPQKQSRQEHDPGSRSRAGSDAAPTALAACGPGILAEISGPGQRQRHRRRPGRRLACIRWSTSRVSSSAVRAVTG